MYAFCDVQASEPADSVRSAEQSVLKDFVKRMRNGYARANAFMDSRGVKNDVIDLRGLPDGEILILDIRLEDRTNLEGSVFGEIQNRTIYLSLNDLIDVLDFPIEYDSSAKRFSGWFVRENRSFVLDLNSEKLSAAGRDFNITDRTLLIRDDDVFAAIDSVENWFGLELRPNIGGQFVMLDANPPIPVMEQIARRKFKERKDPRKPAELPRGDDSYGLLSFPQVDVSTRSSYRKLDGAKSNRSHLVNVRTAGEFAYGTLSTNISATDEEQITNAQVRYFQESADPELLGPLNARRFEVGDLQPTRVPITGNAPIETGVRITNTDPLIRQTLPSTQISGFIFPGWDVELYRDNSLLAFQETDDTGFYSFDNVRLFSNRNFFRVVAYGPQGEIREETVNIPFDPTREADRENIYDVSFSFQNRQFYEKFESDDVDKDTPHFVGFFETPITNSTALQLGARHRDEDGEQKTYASAGVSTSVASALVNSTAATDEEGELAWETSLTRQFGAHNFRADLDLATDDYNPGGGQSPVETFSNRYAVEGPFPFGVGVNPRYGASFNLAENSDGVQSYNGRTNFNTSYKNLGFNQTFTISDSDDLQDGATANSNTSVTGTVGKNTYRFRANYAIKPNSELDTLFASWRRRVNRELDGQIDITHDIEDDLTRLAGQVNWRPDFATITPRFSYTNEGDVEATLNTRFGLTRNPDPGEFIFTRDFVTSNGSINAFVYLDANGNKVFDEGDEPIENARVLTPQNAGGADTDENGVAFISRLRPNIITDVFVEAGSLEDPFWIPAEDGVSIMPRTGTNVRVEIPVHNSGEIDGTVYAKADDGSSKPLRRVHLNLYSEDGEIEQTTKTGPDGFYLFSLVPPGRYALSIADAGLPTDVLRPRPQFIEIGYDGTTIFANDIILEAGKRDIPSEILADLDDYRAYHPHIDFTNNDYKIALNLGQYKSRLLTSFMWYRLKTRYAEILAGTKLYVPPSQSYALPNTGEHTLRVGLGSANLDDAYNRCRALVARDFYCKVEIYPTAKQQKMAAVDGAAR